MLNDKTKKKYQLKNKQNKLKSTKLACQTINMSHKIKLEKNID
jgi:hypothetical protein